MSKQPHNNTQTIIFVLVMSLISAAMLAFAASGLRPRQQSNKQLDIKRNILKCLQVYVDTKEEAAKNPQTIFLHASDDEITEWFSKHIDSLAISPAGDVIELPAGESVGKINAEEEEKKHKLNESYSPRLPLFVLKDADGQPAAYAIPIFGKGLWSTLYGYLALEKNLNDVRGITFYKHGETPGLGAEVENPVWQGNWVGKKILTPSGTLASVKVVKGKAADKAKDDEELSHMVDGLSGATMTCRGVTVFVEKDLLKYQPYFDKHRKGN